MIAKDVNIRNLIMGAEQAELDLSRAAIRYRDILLRHRDYIDGMTKRAEEKLEEIKKMETHNKKEETA